MPKEYTFSAYKAPITNVNPAKNLSIEDVHKLITGNRYKHFTDSIRAFTTKAEQNTIKAKNLDYVTFSGIFEGRSLKGLQTHSNLLCIDFDDIPNVANSKQQIIDTLPPYLLFVSPRGEGLKVVYKIEVTDTNTHLMYYHAFENFFKSELGLKTDAACKDIPRPCFLCHDSEAYLNSNVEVLDHSFIDTFYIEKNEPTKKQIIPQSENQLDDSGLKCWDDFNNRNSILDIVSGELEVVREYGNKIVVKRYGASSSYSGYIYKDTNLMQLFSDGTIYEVRKGYTPFAAYCLKYHNGDFSAAAREIYHLGYGDRIKKKPELVPTEVLSRTLSGYEQNAFIQNLVSSVAFPFEVQDIEHVISQYRLGTIDAAITFPFIDVNHNVRAIQFDEQDSTPVPEWISPYNKVSCLFGEHLLSKYPHNPVALVEAPKTAIYGTLYFGSPEEPTNLLWLSAYDLNYEKSKALKGRNVFLFPDISKVDLWSRKANEIQKCLRGSYFQVSNLMEDNLADYLIEQDWRLFRTQICEKSEKGEAFKKPFFFQPELTVSEKGEGKTKDFFFKEYDTLSYYTRMFWDYRGGKDEYVRHKAIMRNYGK